MPKIWCDSITCKHNEEEVCRRTFDIYLREVGPYGHFRCEDYDSKNGI